MLYTYAQLLRASLFLFAGYGTFVQEGWYARVGGLFVAGIGLWWLAELFVHRFWPDAAPGRADADGAD